MRSASLSFNVVDPSSLARAFRRGPKGLQSCLKERCRQQRLRPVWVSTVDPDVAAENASSRLRLTRTNGRMRTAESGQIVDGPLLQSLAKSASHFPAWRVDDGLTGCSP